MPDHTRMDSSEIETLGAAQTAAHRPGTAGGPNLREALKAAARDVEATLDALLPSPNGGQHRVQEAMRYAVFAGGKRLRPFLTAHCADLFGVERAHSLRAAAAIEALHTYSLV